MSKSVAAETAEITWSQNPLATTHPKRKRKRHSAARCSRNERHLADTFLNVFFVNIFRFSADVHIYLDFFKSGIPCFQLLVKSEHSFGCQAHGFSGEKCPAAVKPLSAICIKQLWKFWGKKTTWAGTWISPSTHDRNKKQQRKIHNWEEV